METGGIRPNRASNPAARHPSAAGSEYRFEPTFKVLVHFPQAKRATPARMRRGYAAPALHRYVSLSSPTLNSTLLCNTISSMTCCTLFRATRSAKTPTTLGILMISSTLSM